MAKLGKDVLGLAAEYAVASELCRRDRYAQLTLGNYKRADLLVDSSADTYRVQVKAKQGRSWPGVQGISRESDFLVLVDYYGKSLCEMPDYYVLAFSDWRRIVRAEARRVPSLQIDDNFRVRYVDGWKGINLKPDGVQRFKSAWQKITGEDGC